MPPSAAARITFRRRGPTAILILWMTLAPASLASGERIKDRWSQVEIPSGFQRATPEIERTFEEMVRKMASAMPARAGETETVQALVFARDSSSGDSELIVMAHASGRLPVAVAEPESLASFKSGMERTIGSESVVNWVHLRLLPNAVEMVEADVSGPRLQERLAVISRNEVLIVLMLVLTGSPPAQPDEVWDSLLASFQTSSSSPVALHAAERPVDWLAFVLALLVLTGAFFLGRSIYRAVMRRVSPYTLFNLPPPRVDSESPGTAGPPQLCGNCGAPTIAGAGCESCGAPVDPPG